MKKGIAIKDNINLEDLFFGVKMYPLGYGSPIEGRQLKTYNLFAFGRIRWSVAKWVLMSPEEKARKKTLHEKLLWCFGDVWSRCEYEAIVCPWGGCDKDTKVVDVGTKVDIFSMYVEPNGELLMELVDKVTATSARRVLREIKR